MLRHKDAACAWLVWKVRNLRPTALPSQTLVPQTNTRFPRLVRAADRHAESGLEGSDGLLLEVVAVQIELRVVDCQAASGALGSAEKGLYGNNRDAVVRTVSRVLEV